MTTYLNSEFKGSSLHAAINNSNSVDGLKRYSLYSDGAVEFHKKEGNNNQITFFTEAKKLADKKLSKIIN